MNENPNLKDNLRKSLIDIPTLIIHHSASNEGKENSSILFCLNNIDIQIVENIAVVEMECEIDVLEDDKTKKAENFVNLNISSEKNSLEEKRSPREDEKVIVNQRSPTFSFYQSNILYTLFLLGYATCIILDVLVQLARKGWTTKSISKITQWAVAILLVNIGLWVDFIIGIAKKKNTLETNNQGSSWLNELISFSSNSLVCIVLLPFFLCRRIFTR